ncbi:hypothetical protein [Paenibacillus endoradicis]|uniref:hypothetical protein n=1 Tax=Paenibacillus endoradicis TaxID=2972487 RepID=UPI0021594B5C|nr:hypothetical protein [Paenibacillus endoradicis]MCR8656920.1 hypothetical protein [Paenibacillus endoradicis]
MAITTNLINNGSIVPQVTRLSNGWLVTAYLASKNNYQLIYSNNEGVTWLDLCKLDAGTTSNPDFDYVISIKTILGNGTMVHVTGSYGDTNDNDRLFTCYFDATTILPTTNIYSSRSNGSSSPYTNVDFAKLMHGNYHYLQTSMTEGSTSNTYYKRHASLTTTAAPNLGAAYVSGTSSDSARNGASEVHAIASGETWIIYGTSNILAVRRKLTLNGGLQAMQTVATLPVGHYIRRINAVEFNGTVYIFFSYLIANNTAPVLAYVTTTNGVSFSAVSVLLNSPFQSTSVQHLDFDVIVDGNSVGFLLAIPNGANRLLYTGKFSAGILTIKSTGLTVTNANGYTRSIHSVAINNRLLYFIANLDNGSNLIKFNLDVEGIKMLVNGVWSNIEQGNRNNGATWQAQNGRQLVNGTWKEIT